MCSVVQGTFATGQNGVAGSISDGLVITAGRTSFRLTLSGLNALRRVKTQKRTSPSGAFADQTTYTADQDDITVTAAEGEEWRVVTVAHPMIRDIFYKLSLES